jgi:hypothetical protein
MKQLDIEEAVPVRSNREWWAVASTFCISALETKDSEMLSRLSLRTSVIAEVIASACLVGTPCDSSFLTCGNHLWPIRSGRHFDERLPDVAGEERRHSRRRRGGETTYQGERVDEEGAAAVGLDELRDAAGAGAGPHLLLPEVVVVVVQEHAAPARGCCGGSHLLPPGDAGGGGCASRWGAVGERAMKREAWEVRAARLRSRGAMTRIQPGFFCLIQSRQAWGGRRRKGQKRKTGRPVCQDKKSFSSFLFFFFIFLIHNTLTYLVFF